MGWSGYGIYAGDCTQSCHYDQIKSFGIVNSDADVEEFLKINKTIIPKDKRHLLKKCQ